MDYLSKLHGISNEKLYILQTSISFFLNGIIIVFSFLPIAT